ncbi:unnamed protein product [Gordionus sp. m RMFG-2023]
MHREIPNNVLQYLEEHFIRIHNIKVGENLLNVYNDGNFKEFIELAFCSSKIYQQSAEQLLPVWLTKKLKERYKGHFANKNKSLLSSDLSDHSSESSNSILYPENALPRSPHHDLLNSINPKSSSSTYINHPSKLENVNNSINSFFPKHHYDNFIDVIQPINFPNFNLSNINTSLAIKSLIDDMLMKIECNQMPKYAKSQFKTNLLIQNLSVINNCVQDLLDNVCLKVSNANNTNILTSNDGNNFPKSPVSIILESETSSLSIESTNSTSSSEDYDDDDSRDIDENFDNNQIYTDLKGSVQHQTNNLDVAYDQLPTLHTFYNNNEKISNNSEIIELYDNNDIHNLKNCHESMIPEFITNSPYIKKKQHLNALNIITNSELHNESLLGNSAMDNTPSKFSLDIGNEGIISYDDVTTINGSSFKYNMYASSPTFEVKNGDASYHDYKDISCQHHFKTDLSDKLISDTSQNFNEHIQNPLNGEQLNTNTMNIKSMDIISPVMECSNLPDTFTKLPCQTNSLPNTSPNSSSLDSTLPYVNSKASKIFFKPTILLNPIGYGLGFTDKYNQIKCSTSTFPEVNFKLDVKTIFPNPLSNISSMKHIFGLATKITESDSSGNMKMHGSSISSSLRSSSQLVHTISEPKEICNKYFKAKSMFTHHSHPFSNNNLNFTKVSAIYDNDKGQNSHSITAFTQNQNYESCSTSSKFKSCQNLAASLTSSDLSSLPLISNLTACNNFTYDPEESRRIDVLSPTKKIVIQNSHSLELLSKTRTLSKYVSPVFYVVGRKKRKYIKRKYTSHFNTKRLKKNPRSPSDSISVDQHSYDIHDESFIDQTSNPTDTATSQQSYKKTSLLWKTRALILLDRLYIIPGSDVYYSPITENQAPDYSKIVKHPMDYSTLRKYIRNGTVTNDTQLLENILIIHTNTLMYNSEDDLISLVNVKVWKLVNECFREYFSSIL